MLTPLVKMRPVVAAAHAVLWRSCLMQTRSIDTCSKWHSWIQQYSTQQLWPGSKTSLLNCASVRLYAKERRGPRSENCEKNVKVDVTGLSELISVDLLQSEMQQSLENLKNEFAKNLSSKSTSGPIERLPVSFQGEDYILRQLCKVVRTRNPRQLILNMSQCPDATAAVIDAINNSGMCLNPTQNGTSLHLSPVPRVTKEYTDNLMSNAKTSFTKCRNMIHQIETKFSKVIKNKENDELDITTIRELVNQIKIIAKTYVAEAEEMYATQVTELSKADDCVHLFYE